jgi:chemosensory pili system protein ChpA (sensor histidine kinase/response regulator)
MRLQDDLDFTTLNWVKQELDETLKQARQALEAYVEDTADSSLMRFCSTYLHQVQGTLRMVELYGAAMVVEEMERVANALLDGVVRQHDEAYAVLMRGIVQLPDYLERLQGGHKDIPIVLLPLLNDLRACRGEKLLSESVLFSPDLGATLPRSAHGPDRATPEAELKAQAGRLRGGFQIGLLHWFRNMNPDAALGGMQTTLDRLRGLTDQDEARRLWWIAGGVVEAVRAGGIDSSAALKLLFGRIDREIKRLADVGEASFRADPPRELVKNLLYYVAYSRADNERTRDIKRTYRLENLLPTEQELTHAKGALGGRNRALLDTVSAAIKDDLMRVKDALDLYLRNPDASASGLGAQTDVLDRVADTLGMLGLGVPRRVVQEQRQLLNDVAAGTRAADEGTLLDIAGALLYVEASLDDNIQTLGASADSGAVAPAGGSIDIELPQAEVRRILDAVMKEAQANLQHAKHDVVAFVEAPWDHQKMQRIPQLLEEIAGAMRMLALDEPAELLDALGRFVEVELLRLKRVPTQDQMDRLADSLASVEYYLESARDQRIGRERILDVTRRSLEALGYWPLPEEGSVEPASELDDLAGGVLEQIPPAAPVPSIDRAAAESFETFSVDTTTLSGAASLRGADDEGDGDRSQLPTIELPGDSLDDFLARLERGEESATDFSAPSAVAPSARLVAERSDAVEIRPGSDLSAQVVGETASTATAPAAQDQPSPAGAAEPEIDYDWIEIEEVVEEPVTARDAGAAAFGVGAAAFQATGSDDIDDEIREVFVEEVQEEIDNLRRQLPLARADLADLELLKPIRRSFHTLKGSGRLVGATALGEFSWRVENMLNRVLERSIQPSMAVHDLLDRAVGALPQMLAGLRGETGYSIDLAAIMAVADRIGAGEDVRVPVSAVRTVKVKRTRRVRVPRPQAAPLVDPVELTAVVDMSDSALEKAAAEQSHIEHAGAYASESPLVPVSMEQLLLPQPVMPLLDPMLLEILRSEVEGHLESIDGYLAGARIAPSPAPESLLRAVHTLHGAISMADVPVISELVGPLENYIKRLRGAAAAPDAIGLAVIEDASRLITSVVALMGQPGAVLPDGTALIARLAALRDGLPEPQSALSLFSPAEEEQGRQQDEARDDALGEPSQDSASVVAADHDGTGEPAPESTRVAAFDHNQADSWLLEDAPADALPEQGFDSVLLRSREANNETGDGRPPAETTLDEDSAELEALLATALAEEAELDALPQVPEVADDEPVFGLSTEELSELEHALDLDATRPLETGSLDAAAVDLASVQSAPVAIDGETAATPIAEPPRAANASAAAFDAAPAPRVAGASEDVDPEGPLVLPDMDEDLVEIFVEEGNDLLDKADTLVARLRDAPGEHEAVVGLQRQLHTIKGNARAVGLGGIGDLSHAMESLLEAAVADRLTLGRPAVELLERGFDRLHRMVARVARRQAVGIPQQTIERFEALVAGEPLAEPTPVSAPEAAPVVAVPAPGVAIAPPPLVAVAEVAAEPAQQAKPRQPAPARALPEPLAEEEATARAPQEMIRVRSDLLDSLVNFAGEVSIYRSRLEQQVGSFRFNLVELDQTTQRLRDQLRKLEIETEAQILSRYQREAEESGQDFDPLELDRFSTQQQLSRALAESVSDLMSLQNALDDLTRGAETLLLQQSRVSSELQEGLMRTRMVPFDSVVPFLRRLLRQTADTERKRASLRIEGAQGEMDRNLLERMKAPFEHMLRNAIAHGIESPADRAAAGKPEEGTVRIAVSREATEVVIRVSDDGRGMDRDAIRRKAIERGLMRPDAKLSDRDLFAFVAETGFSTAEKLTQLAGRGVGMDVVASEIRQLGGSMSIDSQRGAGTEFAIRLPFTLAVTQAILVRLGDQVFAVPMSSVQGVARIGREDFDRRIVQERPAFAYAGEEYVIHELNNLLGVPGARAVDDAQLPLLLARTGDQRAAIRVDGVLGSREIVVKSVGPQVNSVPGIFGATIMGDGSVVMILDVAPLVRRSAALREATAVEDAIEDAMPGLIAPPAPVAAAPEVRRQPLVMVVDDSITMRKVTSRVLERNDMEVLTAKDGLDAVEKLQDRIPDLMLLDIEMPRMDGYELATYMRNDPRLRSVPIIMITSRTGEKHRQRAFEIGVDRYLGKPYQEADLLRNVEETLRLSRALD